MKTPLRALVVEDSEDDVALIVWELSRGGFAVTHRRVETASELVAALETGGWDIIIADYSLPAFSGLAALDLVKSRGCELPFIMLSGIVSEETAVNAMHAGAHDFVAKGKMARLVPAIRRELREAVVRRERHAAAAVLRLLPARILAAQEEERGRIARELHDEIGQALTGAQLLVAAARHSRGSPQAARTLEECAAILERTLGQVRNLSLDLRPPQLDDFGLAEALRWQIERQSRAAGLAFRFDATPLETRLRPDVKIACFRAAQEALNNVARHARATRVEVRLGSRDGALELCIEDDGRGFEPAAAHEQSLRGMSMGLAGMRERVALAGGRVEIRSAPGAGTTLCVVFPHAEDDSVGAARLAGGRNLPQRRFHSAQ